MQGIVCPLCSVEVKFGGHCDGWAYLTFTQEARVCIPVTKNISNNVTSFLYVSVLSVYMCKENKPVVIGK